MTVFADNMWTIGRTPLVQVNRLAAHLDATVLAKIEGRNPSYSVKCRIAVAMIREAEQSGALLAGMNVVEASSGNTGIALAFVCAARGYSLTLVMPENMSQERQTLLRAYGANLILTPASQGMLGSIRTAEKLASESGWYMPDQFRNPANPQVHFETTGPEIWDDTEGKIDVLVCGVGTGGTITGIGRYLKHFRKKQVHIIAVEPAGSPVLSGKKPGRHAIQGLGVGFVPELLDLSLIDQTVAVSDDAAISTARRIMSEEGISCGISCGAAMYAALAAAAETRFAGKQIVTILPDAGERYLSTVLFDPFQSMPSSARQKPKMQYLYSLLDE
jgi:cysteine synthase A